MNVNIVDLNDDVLRRICDYLSGKDALHFSLTAKRFHDLATTRVGVSLTAGYHRKFLSFLRSGTHPGLPPRVQHLERLVLKPGLYSMSASYRSDREDLNRRENEFVTILGLLVELLSAAHNLHSLTLPGASAFLLRDSRLGTALSALPHLQHVTFGCVSDTAVKFVGETGWDLRTLDLNYNSPYGDSPMRAADEHMRTIPVLHNALAQFRNLHTLKITHFKIGGWDLSHLTPTSPVPVFPTIRRLFIAKNLPLFALDLVDRCPNVEIVDLDSCHDGEDADLRNLRNTPWPPLRSLRVDTLLPRPSGGHAERLLARSTADHLQITTQILLPMTLEDNTQSEVRNLLWFMGRTSPLYAQISVTVNPKPMSFWDRVAESAPRLRYLELEVSLRDLDEECASWVVRPLPYLAPSPFSSQICTLIMMLVGQCSRGTPPTPARVPTAAHRASSRQTRHLSQIRRLWWRPHMERDRGGCTRNVPRALRRSADPRRAVRTSDPHPEVLCPVRRGADGQAARLARRGERASSVWRRRRC